MRHAGKDTRTKLVRGLLANDQKTDPAGTAGARLVCGVIRRARR